MNITEDEFWETTDRSRSEHLWTKKNNDWVLRNNSKNNELIMSYNNSHIYEKLSFRFYFKFSKKIFRNEKNFFSLFKSVYKQTNFYFKDTYFKIDLFDEKYLSYNESLQYRKLKF